jgi:hypothetical protein
VPPHSYWRVSSLHWADQLSPEGEEAGPIPIQPNAANARLIAAAPDLLDALQNMLSCADAGDMDSLANASADARAAIQKATQS